MIDSHAHVYLEQFKEDKEDIIQRSHENGLEKIYMPNIDHSSIEDMLEMELKYPGFCIPMIGLHPCSVKKDFEKELYIIEDWLNKREWSAIGEIGLDLYWDKSTFEIQKEVLKIQIQWSIKYELPFVIHCREAFNEIFELLEEFDKEQLKGVFHCFTGGEEELAKIIDLDFYFGLGGVSTFKNQDIDELIHKMPENRILLETDSPYLAPVPKRGKRNEPSYLKYIAEHISNKLNRPLEEIDKFSSRNTLEFFKEIND